MVLFYQQSRQFRPKTLRLFSYFHFFLSTWVFATLVAFDIIVRNRSAKITAFLGSVQLPDSLIEAQEKALGVNPEYWSNSYREFTSPYGAM